MFKFWKRKPVQQATTPTDDLIRHIVSLPPDEWSVLDGELIHRSGMKVAWDILSVRITVPAEQGSKTPITIKIPNPLSVPSSCVHTHYDTGEMPNYTPLDEILDNMAYTLMNSEITRILTKMKGS